jgi:hypothetical protein
MTTGQWIFMATTIAANGSTPAVHMWVGVGGSLVDELAGVSKTTKYGTPAWPPNVTAGPLILGGYPFNTMSGSYAGLLVYNRALSYPECVSLYQSFKTKMVERGVTVE